MKSKVSEPWGESDQMGMMRQPGVMSLVKSSPP
jgi:hypothetical protein